MAIDDGRAVAADPDSGGDGAKQRDERERVTHQRVEQPTEEHRRDERDQGHHVGCDRASHLFLPTAATASAPVCPQQSVRQSRGKRMRILGTYGFAPFCTSASTHLPPSQRLFSEHEYSNSSAPFSMSTKVRVFLIGFW